MISFKDFKKVELKTAKIVEVEDVEGKDLLYKIKIDLGSKQCTTIAGIKDSYSKDELLGKTLIVVANLEPAKIAGIESEAMLLAAKDADGKYRIVTLDGNAAPGTKVE